MRVKNFIYSAFLIAILLVTSFLSSCNSSLQQTSVVVEDSAAKELMQGTWTNEMEGNVVFVVKGDTIYYNDSISNPSSFRIVEDTLVIDNHNVVKYPIRKLTSSELVFINAEGDEVELCKSNEEGNPHGTGEYKGTVNLNQGRKVKNDTVMTFDGKHYHAYTQVNPTTYKVYRQTVNSDGLSVESVYYDNIVYIALYEGQQKVFGQNFAKDAFEHLVPHAYLEQAVLSEIIVDSANKDGVRFVAILSIPDSYTNYRVNIDVSRDGQKKLSV